MVCDCCGASCAPDEVAYSVRHEDGSIGYICIDCNDWEDDIETDEDESLFESVLKENERRKGAIDLDSIPDEKYALKEKGHLSYVVSYADEHTASYHCYKGKVSISDPWRFKHSITKASRINDIKLFDSPQEAKNYLKNIKNTAEDYSYKEKPAEKDVQQALTKYINSFEIISMKDFKEILYPIFGEVGAGVQSEPYVLAYFDEENEHRYSGAFTRIQKDGSWRYPNFGNLNKAKIYNSEKVALMDKEYYKQYFKSYYKDLKPITVTEAKKLEDEERVRAATEKAEQEALQKQHHEEYLKSDAHKEELEAARNKRAKEKEYNPGTYDVRFFYSNSWLGSVHFEVKADSIDDAFRKGKAAALRNDPYANAGRGYDYNLRFNKNYIRKID